VTEPNGDSEESVVAVLADGADANSPVSSLPNAEQAFDSPRQSLTRQQQRLLVANTQISLSPPDRMDFLHTVMCQVGLPRSFTPERTFERHNGHMSILLEAGKLFDGQQFVDRSLPYGATPRLVLVHVSSEAIRTRSRTVEIGHSMRQFLHQLGMQTSGGERGGYTMLKKQMECLAACRLTIGMQNAGRVVTVDAKPIKRFEAWLHQDGSQRTLWPGVLELSTDFYDTLQEHAVPLDHRALGALKHSALALDIYTWLAHRLCRISNPRGVRLSWQNLRDQFGEEYNDGKNFKRKFAEALRQVSLVYPAARVTEVIGGIQLHASHPPLAPTTVAFSQQIHIDADRS
jgi:Plasmid encoded RepA protein